MWTSMEKDIIEIFIEETNKSIFPYQIVLCSACETAIVGDAEQWPPTDMNSCSVCDKVWCRKCSKFSVDAKVIPCEECCSPHCPECVHITDIGNIIDSFVAPEDVKKLWNIIRKIKDNTLKIRTSIIVLYGDGSNGKTVLTRILQKIASSSQVTPHFLDESWNYSRPQPLIEQVNKDLVVIGEAETHQTDEVIDGTQKWIRRNHRTIARMPFSYDSIEIKPGVFIFSTNIMPKVKVERARRMPILLKLPNTFDAKIDPDILIEQGVKEINKMC